MKENEKKSNPKMIISRVAENYPTIDVISARAKQYIFYLQHRRHCKKNHGKAINKRNIVKCYFLCLQVKSKSRTRTKHFSLWLVRCCRLLCLLSFSLSFSLSTFVTYACVCSVCASKFLGLLSCFSQSSVELRNKEEWNT